MTLGEARHTFDRNLFCLTFWKIIVIAHVIANFEIDFVEYPVIPKKHAKT